MNIDEEDMEKAKEIVRLNNETDTYCKLFDADCKGCKIEKFKNKYGRLGKMKCSDVYRYLKEKGEI